MLQTEINLFSGRVRVDSRQIDSAHAIWLEGWVSFTYFLSSPQKYRAEFESYYLLYNLGHQEALSHYLELSLPLRLVRGWGATAVLCFIGCKQKVS